MATVVASLEATLDLNKKGFEKGLKDSRKGLSDLGNKMGQATGKGGKLGGILNKVGGGLSGLAPVAATGVGAIAVGAGAAATAVGAVGVALFDLAQQSDAATRQIATGLGITTEAAQKYESSLEDVLSQNPASNFGEIAQTITLVERAIDGLDKASLDTITSGALKLEKRFGRDVGETVGAAEQLVERFGVTGAQAMDLITRGIQTIPAEDLLDTISEYSNQFADAGFDAAQMLSILETGAAGGVLGTDKIGDGIKEMIDRLTEGGDDAAEAFEALTGQSFADVTAAVSAGESTWADYFDNIIGGLSSLDDPIAKQQAAVAIFGEQAVDLGAKVIAGLDPAATALEDVAGSTDKLGNKFGSIGEAMQSVKTDALIALKPIGDTLLDLANKAIPVIKQGFENLGPSLREFAEKAGPIIEKFVTGLGPAIRVIGDQIGRVAESLGLVSGESDGVTNALGILEMILNGVTIAFQSAAGVMMLIAETIDFVADGVKMFIDLHDLMGQIVVGVWNKIKEGVESVGNAIQSPIEGLKTMASTLGEKVDRALPDWLRMDSPPPLAVALDMVKEGLEAIPDVSQTFSGGTLNPLQAPVTSGSTTTTSNVTVNIDGVSVSSTTGNDPNTEAIRMTIDLLTQALQGAT